MLNTSKRIMAPKPQQMQSRNDSEKALMALRRIGSCQRYELYVDPRRTHPNDVADLQSVSLRRLSTVQRHRPVETLENHTILSPSQRTTRVTANVVGREKDTRFHLARVGADDERPSSR